MVSKELYSEDNEATYCPEDNKLRLYVGRVPREEYLSLKKEGWTSTPKQGCDFSAVWRIEREDTCFSYAGIIGDEDQSPEDRAVDRAERFAGYREKRRDEAHGTADSFESMPMVHGFQNQQKAERAAAKHARIGVSACNLWSKAEYWQRRTAGVISHALHKSTPAARMGRIILIEKDIRRVEAHYTPDKAGTTLMRAPYRCPVCDRHSCTEHEEATIKIHQTYCGSGRSGEWHYTHNLPKIKEAYSRYLNHLKLRLTYENQMIAADGGLAGELKMVPGGFYGAHRIVKINKSRATMRVVSVDILVPRVDSWTYRTTNLPGTEYALSKHRVEKMAKSTYREPTEEELLSFKVLQKEIAAGKKSVTTTIPFINPTVESAEKLQKVWNDEAEESYNKYLDSHLYLKGKDGYEYIPTPVSKMTMNQYKHAATGYYNKAKTIFICSDGQKVRNYFEKAKDHHTPALKVRQMNIKVSMQFSHRASSVVVLTDKKQKPLPITLKETVVA